MADRVLPLKQCSIVLLSAGTNDIISFLTNNIQLRVLIFFVGTYLCFSLKDGDEGELPVYTPIIIVRLGNINLDSAFTDHYKYNQISLQVMIPYA